MKSSESDVRRMYQGMTARRSEAECLGEETLIRVACGEANRRERERVVEHLAQCSDCARDYQIARGLRPLRSTANTASKRLLLPLAAMLALAVAGLGWMSVVQQRNGSTIAALRHELASRPGPSPVAIAKPSALAPQIGTPIVDLDADPTRGESRSLATVELRRGIDLYTLILHLPVGWDGAVEISVDGGAPLPATAVDGSVTMTLHRNTAGIGKHVIHVRSRDRQIDFPFVVQEP